MKARVKETGEIIEIAEDYSYVYAKHFDKTFSVDSLEFLYDSKGHSTNSDDYWEKLKHQYAGMAMQGIMANSLFMPYDGKEIADISNDVATALVEKLKSESNEKN